LVSNMSSGTPFGIQEIKRPDGSRPGVGLPEGGERLSGTQGR